jgi:hypothetical protein
MHWRRRSGSAASAEALFLAGERHAVRDTADALDRIDGAEPRTGPPGGEEEEEEEEERAVGLRVQRSPWSPNE